MKLAEAHPEFRRALRWVPNLPYHKPVFCRFAQAAMKLMPEFRGDNEVLVDYVHHGQAESKLYRPASGGSGAALLWIHGGGYLFGHPKQDDPVCRGFVQELGLTVVSVNYRVATTHPFPAALDDCISAWDYLQDNAENPDLDPRRIAIGGQSAGGGLAAALAQKLLDRGGNQPIAQVLFCPMLDDRTATRTELDGQRHFVWTNHNNRSAWKRYLNQDAGLTRAPEYAVPARRESLRGLPPTWLGVGTLDLFYEEDVIYAGRLQEQGVSCDLKVTQGAPHAFESFFMNSNPGKACWKSCYEFLRRVLTQ